MAKSPRIYVNDALPHVDIPSLDLLTFLFDSEHCLAQEGTVLHVDAYHPDHKLTKANLRDLAQRIGHGLREQYGVGKTGPNKDVVTVMSYGQIAIPALLYGVMTAGGVYSAASPSSTVAELARQIEMGKSNLVVCSTEHRDVALKAAKQVGVPASRVLIVESYPSISLSSVEGSTNAISDQKLMWQKITDAEQLKESVVTILWSSGTTGLPKGVALSHLNFVAELYIISIQNRIFAQKLMETDPASVPPFEYKTLGHLPISHIAGLGGYLMIVMYSGGTVYWMRKYKWEDLIKYAKQYKITAFYTVPSIYLRISKSPEVQDAFADVVAASTGAAPMDGELMKASNSKLGDGKSTFVGQTWGLSESTGAVTAVPSGQTDDTGCIGFLLPNCELRVIDENFQDVEPGQEGELLIRAPVVMQGYWNNPQATKDAFHDFKDDGKGSWFLTGDIGVQRNGKFYVVDRKKELLKYKGLQVAPAELENLLFTHPAVAEAAVVGVPAPEDPGTDLPRAYVVLAPDWRSSLGPMPISRTQGAGGRASAQDSPKQDALGQTRYSDRGASSPSNSPSHPSESSSGSDSSKQDTLSQTRYSDTRTSSPLSHEAAMAEELKKYVADRLAQYKQLRGGIKFVPEIPKNAIGKFLRRDLRQRAKKEIEDERRISRAKL